MGEVVVVMVAEVEDGVKVGVAVAVGCGFIW